MPLTDYTSYNEVRGVLGVSTDELEDTTLGLDVYLYALQADLEAVDVTLAADFAAVVAIAEGSRTEAQQRFFKMTKLFSTYQVAKQLGSSLPMFGPKDITDGKASISRFADSPYKATLARIEREYERFRTTLAEAYAALSAVSATVVAPIFMVVSSPSSDPVTGT